MAIFDRVKSIITGEDRKGHAERNAKHIHSLSGGDERVLHAARIKDYARRATIVFGCRERGRV